MVSIFAYGNCLIYSKNTLFKEIVDKNLAVKDRKGNLPYEDAVLDFSNPETVTWYQGKLKKLFDQGVSVFKVDFGEAAPPDGIYHSVELVSTNIICSVAL
jgi:alpha-D-xyloside xylohydrolase